MITLQDAEANVGGLVKYDDGNRPPEFGLIQSSRLHGIGSVLAPDHNPEVWGTVFVRFSLGDTAAGCRSTDLTLIVPAMKTEERVELRKWRDYGERLASFAEAIPDNDPGHDTVVRLLQMALGE